MTPAQRSLFADVAILLTLIAIAVVGYRYSPLLLPKADLTAKPAAGCNLNRETCSVKLADGRSIDVSITPHPIPVVKPLLVSVAIHGFSAQKVEIDFAGATMNMGYNRQALKAEAGDRFSGEAMLPVCVTGRMEWLATLLVETGNQRISVPFLFFAPDPS